MKAKRLGAALLLILFALVSLGGAALGEGGAATEADPPAATEAPTAANAPEATDAPAATEAPTAANPPAATDAPAATEAPTAADAPEVTATVKPTYPRIVADDSRVVADLTHVTQGGYVLMALPIGYEAAQGQVIWSNEFSGSLSGWTTDSEANPGYFKHDITQYLSRAEWKIKGIGFELSSVFDMSDGDARNIIAYAPKDNPWSMAEGAAFSMGYAVFRLPVRADAPGGNYTVEFEFRLPDSVMNDEAPKTTLQFSLNAPAATVTPSAAPSATPSDPAVPAPTDAPVYAYVVLGDPSSMLNLRAEASASGAVLTKLAHGTQVQVLSERDGWSLVSVNGMQGYVNSGYLGEAAPGGATTTPGVSYPRIAFNAADVICDLSAVKPDGRLLVALPIGYETAENSAVWSHAQGAAYADWKAGAEVDPAHFKQDIVQYLTEARWYATLKLKNSQSGDLFYSVFDVNAADNQNVIAYAHANNTWGLSAGAAVNAGYATFDMPIRSDAPDGDYVLTFEFAMPSGVTNSAQELTYRVEFSLKGGSTQAPSATDAPGDDPTDAPTDTPADGDDEGDEGNASAGTIMIGQSSVQTVKVRQTNVTLAVPVSYVIDNLRVYSNHTPDGSQAAVGLEPDEYSQDILDYVDWLEVGVAPETAASGEFPFQLAEQGAARTVIADGVNSGYAVFTGLTVKSGLSNGTMAVPLNVRWMESGDDTIYSTEITALINVTGASTGGGGGGGFVAATTPPQARVMVESLKTDPAEVKAGDRFDLVFSIRNTSATQYVQNMRVTISSEEDALIPFSGSNTLYIDRIDANAVYELRYPVRANMEVPDHPIKVEVSIEYEDSKVAAQTAGQTLVVDVDQNRRVKIDDPVLDSASPMAGDSLTATLQVINEGRTMLYNVTVTAQCDNEEIILPASGYLGNMEGGTSKKATLDLIPTGSGDYEVTFRVTYEDAMGEQYSDERTTTFYAQEEPSYDDYYYFEDDSSNGMDDYEESGLTAEVIMQMLPGWIYALGGTILTLAIVLMGLSARNRRRKALEEDEMD